MRRVHERLLEGAAGAEHEGVGRADREHDPEVKADVLAGVIRKRDTGWAFGGGSG